MQQTLTCDANTVSSDGHTLTFLANSGTRMTNGYTVDLATLQAQTFNLLWKHFTRTRAEVRYFV